MKNEYPLLFLILIPVLAVLISFTGGPPAGNTGSPLDGQDCTNCHPTGPATSVSGWITTDIPAEGYSPGETYTITVSGIDLSAPKYGFQVTAETAAVKTGLWIITDDLRTQSLGTAVTHTSAGTSPMGTPNAWAMDWTAPASGTGAVTFYASVNAANGDGSNQGDMIYVTALNVAESTIGISESFTANVGNIYPNPGTNYINIRLPLQSQSQVFDNIGRELISMPANTECMSIDISNLEVGVYYVKIHQNGQTANRRFVKR